MKNFKDYLAGGFVAIVVVFAVSTALLLMVATAQAGDRVYLGTGSIVCETEAAAEQMYVVDREYDGTVGICNTLPRPMSAVELRCEFLNPICAYELVPGLIVYAHPSWLK